MGTAAITGVYARGLFFEKQLDNTRAGAAQSFPTIHSARGTRNKKQPLSLHKRPVPTSPLPLTPAFLQPSASGERSDIPRPCLKKQGRRGGAFPWGGSSLPDGRAFRIPFPSSGKVSPARGAHYKQYLITKNQKQNFNTPASPKKITLNNPMNTECSISISLRGSA